VAKRYSSLTMCWKMWIVQIGNVLLHDLAFWLYPTWEMSSDCKAWWCWSVPPLHLVGPSGLVLCLDPIPSVPSLPLFVCTYFSLAIMLVITIIRA
jgi:hypothetical protein